MRKITLVFTILTLGIELQAQTDSLTNRLDTLTSEEDYIFVNPEIAPQFPGGYDSLYAFIERNNNWSVGQLMISGKVFVEFVVEKDGRVTNVNVVKGLHETYDVEAERLVNLFPNFEPASLSGEPIRMKMVIPILFNGLK